MAAVNLANIFGNEINAVAQPRQADIQYNGIPGANGLLRMHLGTRGRPIIVTGRLRAYDTDYDDARAELQDIIDAIEARCYLGVAPIDVSWMGVTYQYVVFDKFEIIGERNFGYTAGGYCVCNFRCVLRELV